MSPTEGEGGYIVFGADPVSLSVGVGVGGTLSCLHNISFTSEWIFNQICMDVTLGHDKELIRFC